MILQKAAYRRLARVTNRIRGRRIHCYCVGAAKTGTTSIAASFESHYRTMHEPEVPKTNRLIIDYLEHDISESDLRRALIARDKRLNLEMESNHPLGYISGVLADLFPDALFLVTVRDPYSWLESRLNFHYKKDPLQWREYRHYFWISRQTEYAPEEEELRRLGLCSLDVYLSQYADQYRRVLSAVPPERRLIVRTGQINDQLPSIAAFIGAPSSNVVTSAHSNQQKEKIAPLDKINVDFVRSRVHEHCSDILSEFFPEHRNRGRPMSVKMQSRVCD